MASEKTSAPGNSLAGQISLFRAPEVPDAFRKAVQVVHSKAKTPLSLMQRKLGNAWLKNAIEHQPDFDGWWTLGIKELSTSIGFDSNNRDYLKKSAGALMRIVFEWDVMAPANKRVQWKASVLFPELEIRSDVIRYQISAQMRERMINPDIYAMIDMNVVRRFRRASSLGIWEYCVRYEKLGRTAEVEWEKFRDMLLGESGEAKTYKEYKYFKSKVMRPAIAEINAESDHTIKLIEAKVGRSVQSVRFEITRRKGKVGETTIDDRHLELVSELVKLGVPQSEAKRMLKLNEYDQIKRALTYTKRRTTDKKLGVLQNPAAYFRHALSHHYADSEPVEGEVQPAPSEARPQVDIKQVYATKMAVQAEHYFNELDPEDQAPLIAQYNAQQKTTTLRLKSKVSKLAQVAFFRWIAQNTWGDPTAEDLLGLAVNIISEGNTGAS